MDVGQPMRVRVMCLGHVESLCLDVHLLYETRVALALSKGVE